MKTGQKGIELIKKFEGCKLTAYKCPAGLMTIGWGNTYYSNGAKVKVGDKITQAQADELLLTLLPKYEKTVNNNIKVALTQNQFDALVSFCWNCGSSNTLFSKVNLNASDLMEWWKNHYIMGGGKVLQGLVNRRKAESELYQLK
ncbi:Endolysin/autolysin [uncultured Caudovirales phage]|uniref:Endolysin n=1 Tax=uncultured Caudovirales phage TaxID=2100421 RepID=A0A6J5LIA3_9CAUD|nr:Endolysin/autolysin [uncultured Caudovirales phage]CAB4134348.1 COG3772 Phage-related lysozyme (muraminidase) [uncultured Caudovirales phage]